MLFTHTWRFRFSLASLYWLNSASKAFFPFSRARAHARSYSHSLTHSFLFSKAPCEADWQARMKMRRTLARDFSAYASFWERPLKLDHITMGAVWAARDFCLFLLLLNSRQSAALPEFRGGTVVSVWACVCVVLCSCGDFTHAFPRSALHVVSPAATFSIFS